MVTQDRLHELFDYKDGQLIAKIKRKRRNVGDVMGSKTDRGYLAVCVDGKNYKVHRIIYLYHHGNLPEQIDHINGIRTDNRIENLRPATDLQNSQNRKPLAKSGVKGVYWNKRSKKWVANICVNRKNKHLGSFKTLEEAAMIATSERLAAHKDYAWKGEK
jgi:hypothetical protein